MGDKGSLAHLEFVHLGLGPGIALRARWPEAGRGLESPDGDRAFREV